MEERVEGPGPEGPSEEELRAAIEEQLRQARVEDLLVQTTVSLVNLTARRIGIEEERDLAQAKLGIDSVRALVDLLPEEVRDQVRQALSQLQLQFVQLSDGEAGSEGAGAGGASGPSDAETGGGSEPPRRPAGGGGGLWTPPGSV